MAIGHCWFDEMRTFASLMSVVATNGREREIKRRTRLKKMKELRGKSERESEWRENGRENCREKCPINEGGGVVWREMSEPDITCTEFPSILIV